MLDAYSQLLINTSSASPSEPEFYVYLVYKFRKIIGKYDFPNHFKKIIVRYKKIGYNIDVLRQTAFLVGWLIWV